MVKTTVLLVCDQLFGALIHLNFIILILYVFNGCCLVLNYVIYSCSSARVTPGVSPYRTFILEENIVSVIPQVRVIGDNLKRQTKTPNFVYLQIILTNLNFTISQQLVKKYSSFYPPSFFNIHSQLAIEHKIANFFLLSF